MVTMIANVTPRYVFFFSRRRPLRETFRSAYILYIRFANRHCTGFRKKLTGLYSSIAQTRFHSLSLFPRQFRGRLLCVRVDVCVLCVPILYYWFYDSHNICYNRINDSLPFLSEFSFSLFVAIHDTHLHIYTFPFLFQHVLVCLLNLNLKVFRVFDEF